MVTMRNDDLGVDYEYYEQKGWWDTKGQPPIWRIKPTCLNPDAPNYLPRVAAPSFADACAACQHNNYQQD